MMEALRSCKRCGIEAFTREDLESFKKSTTSRYGRAPVCKECSAIEAKELRDAGKVGTITTDLPFDDHASALRSCTHCDVKAYTKEDLEDFQLAKGAKYSRANLCKACAVAKATKNKESKPPMSEEKLKAYRKSQRKWHLKKTYNLTLEDFDIMLDEQGGVCKICGCEAYNERNAFREYLVVDHCHDTGVVRGLLCSQCNIGLGSFNDNLSLVASATKYLEETQV